MAERTKSVGKWLRGLLGATETPVPRGETHALLGARALEVCAGLAGDAVCRTGRPANGDDPPLDRLRNAFDRDLVRQDFESAPAALAAASGMALSGMRAAVLLPLDRLDECAAQLRAAVDRQLPLVIQATAGSRPGPGVDTALASGAFVLVARDAQQACDLTLVAHRCAERSLTPGVVVLDGAEAAWTVSQIELPDAERVRELLGDSASPIECPTRAQSLLFGDRRRSVPRWFDLERPLASGVEMTGADRAAAAAARRLLVSGHVARIADEAMQAVSSATGRPLSAASAHGLDDARQVVVATGSAVPVVEAVADRLRSEGSGRGGVLGLTRLTPFPDEEVRQALSRAEVVTLLERREAPPSRTPLFERLGTAVSGGATRLLSATCDRPVPGELAAAYANMNAGPAARTSVQLGLTGPADAADHPRRQALVQRSRRDCPELDDAVLDASPRLDLRPRGARTVELRIASNALPGAALEGLSAGLRDSVGPYAAARSDELEPGLWLLRITAAGEPVADPGTGSPADVVLVAELRLVPPAAALSDHAILVIASELDGAELWSALPSRLRRTIRRHNLELYRAVGEDELIALGASLAAGTARGLEPLAWSELPDDPLAAHAPTLPLAVRRLGEPTGGPSSVARFWGEFVQPRIEREPGRTEIDPNLALGTMPACTAGLQGPRPGVASLPRIDPGRCTACGKCWVACPDTAIAAVALGPQALLDAAAELGKSATAVESDAAAGKLKRAHRQLAARWAGGIAGSETGAVEITGLDEAFTWLVDAMKLPEDERATFGQLFASTRDWIGRLPFGHSAALFHDLETEQKGTGALQLLAVDPRACQGCGICAAVCDDDAIRLEARDEDRWNEARATWDAWEQLPDTSGKLIARASKDARIGPLAAVLLSRHCLLSLVGGDAAEPGSGERIAVRQISAVVEYAMQRRRLAQVKRWEELTESLRERIVGSLSQAVSVDDLGSLDRALDAAPASRSPLGPVMERLEELGQRTDVDVPSVRKLVRTAQELEETIAGVTRGLSGAGMARYGVVVAGPNASAWAATFPRNPFGVPLAVQRSGSAAELAMGLAHGLRADAVREARLVRRAELLLDAPADLPAKERELESLQWTDLTVDERRASPPILLLVDDHLAELRTLLSSDLPVKAFLLDPCDLRSDSPDLLLPAVAEGTAFVAGTSPAYPDHLFDSVTGALEFGGPAVISIHAPSPSRHGFPIDRTIERARGAVRCRVQPLVRFEPSADGGLGRGISLKGNAALEESWDSDAQGVPLTPAIWAEGEERFAADRRVESGVRQCARNWLALQELAGVATPFVGQLEERLRGELKAAHKVEIDALREEHEAKLREVEARQTRSQAARLKERLMQLAGYREGGTEPPPDNEDDS